MIALRVVTPIALEEQAVTALWELGTTGIEVRAGREDRCDLLAFFHAQPDEIQELKRRARALLPSASIVEADVPVVDWVARFREGFREFTVGPFLIAPVWREPTTDGLRLLRVDPGRAFGTGTHETTRLCLLLLDRLAERGPLGRVMDVGTGTGLLAIAALKLGATSAVASDIDPDALDSSTTHARLNASHLALVQADLARPFRANACDLLLANLTAPLLIENAADLARVFVARAILAGFLVEDVPRLRAASAAIDPNPAVETLGEWAAILIERRHP
jgi:ribosomal protein L11 methyltransferase